MELKALMSEVEHIINELVFNSLMIEQTNAQEVTKNLAHR
jgi:hypothetical protein